jgi:hypothetical protein
MNNSLAATRSVHESRKFEDFNITFDQELIKNKNLFKEP